MKIVLSAEQIEGHLVIKDSALAEYIGNHPEEEIFLKRCMISATLSVALKMYNIDPDMHTELDDIATNIAEVCENIFSGKNSESDMIDEPVNKKDFWGE